MSNFNIKRFGRMAVWTFRMEGKGLLACLGGITFGFLVCATAYLWPVLKSGIEIAGSSSEELAGNYILVFTIYNIIGGSFIFNNISTMTARLTYRMLPATDLEKFLTRALLFAAVWPLMGLIALLIADGLRFAVCLYIGAGGVESAVPAFFRLMLMSEGSAKWLAVAVWTHSFFILGGALFRRYQFVITAVVYVVLLNLVSKINVSVTGAGYSFDVFCDYGGPIFLAAALIDWWLAYRVFHRSQLINNKWINL